MSYARLGRWQKWNDKRFKAFLKQFYGEQLTLAYKIADKSLSDTQAMVAMAVFEKIAPPAVYLKHVYEEYLKDIEKTNEIGVCEDILSD